MQNLNFESGGLETSVHHFFQAGRGSEDMTRGSITLPVSYSSFANPFLAHGVLVLQSHSCMLVPVRSYESSFCWLRCSRCASAILSYQLQWTFKYFSSQSHIFSTQRQLVWIQCEMSANWLLTFSRDGNDGAWSSFAVQVGTPPQAVRLLPSITGNSIWAVWSYGCDQSDDSDCPSLRGNLFNISASSTWKDQGNYSLPLNPEHYLPYTGAAAVGFDNITV